MLKIGQTYVAFASVLRDAKVKIKINARDRRHDVSRLKPERRTRASLSPYARERVESDRRKFSGDVRTPETPVRLWCDAGFREISLRFHWRKTSRKRAIVVTWIRGRANYGEIVFAYVCRRLEIMRIKSCETHLMEHKIRRLNRKSETRLNFHLNKHDFELIRDIWQEELR